MYIARNDKNWKVIKKYIGKSELGRNIYKDVLEVNCKECGNTFNQEFSINENEKLNVNCPFCNKSSNSIINL